MLQEILYAVYWGLLIFGVVFGYWLPWVIIGIIMTAFAVLGLYLWLVGSVAWFSTNAPITVHVAVLILGLIFIIFRSDK